MWQAGRETGNVSVIYCCCHYPGQASSGQCPARKTAWSHKAECKRFAMGSCSILQTAAIWFEPNRSLGSGMSKEQEADLHITQAAADDSLCKRSTGGVERETERVHATSYVNILRSCERDLSLFCSSSSLSFHDTGLQREHNEPPLPSSLHHLQLHHSLLHQRLQRRPRSSLRSTHGAAADGPRHPQPPASSLAACSCPGWRQHRYCPA